MTAPKLFISYSWSDPEHQQWVLDLATALRESGVDAILDKWDLKEGHDAVAFMEKMVTDPEIGKVAMICDKTYAEKADGRAGGVGTETRIISAEVYAKQAQEKFVAVVREKDEEGKPCVPTYYKSRIHIDFSEDDRYADSFDFLRHPDSDVLSRYRQAPCATGAVQRGKKTMIHSEILEEKYRVQAKLAAESASVRDYLERSRREAQEVAREYGFEIKYADLPGAKLAMDKDAIQKAIEDANR